MHRLEEDVDNPTLNSDSDWTQFELHNWCRMSPLVSESLF